MRLKIDIFKDGKLIETWISLDKESILIGRQVGDLLLNDPRVSRSHALLYVDPFESLAILDLDSANGTYIEGKSIESARLKIGSVIEMGGFELSIAGFELNQEEGGIPKAESFEIIRGGENLLKALPEEKLKSFIDFFDAKDVAMSERLRKIKDNKIK